MASENSTPEDPERRPTSWRFVLAGFFVTFLSMVAAIYWIIRTGKL